MGNVMPAATDLRNPASTSEIPTEGHPKSKPDFGCLVDDSPALVLAPMEGVTDAPMRALQGECGAFTYCVSEFLRVSQSVPPAKVFLHHIPELRNGSVTPTGLPVQVQLLGGDAQLMAASALKAVECGAAAIDINFGCPAPTVNRHDGGATLLKYPKRIREIVAAVRAAVPKPIPVSAKLRLGWDSIDAIHENATMAAEGGASWITIHARTRTQGYEPPVYWPHIGLVRKRLGIPVIANGDIWNLADFHRCRDETGCARFMLGRGALGRPGLAGQVAAELGLRTPSPLEGEGEVSPLRTGGSTSVDWHAELQKLIRWTSFHHPLTPEQLAKRMKQWLRMGAKCGTFERFDEIKRLRTAEEILDAFAVTSSVRSPTA
jgi:tRNA-dihydrouridine synthase C